MINLSLSARFIVNLTSRNGLEIKKKMTVNHQEITSSKPFQFYCTNVSRLLTFLLTDPIQSLTSGVFRGFAAVRDHWRRIIPAHIVEKLDPNRKNRKPHQIPKPVHVFYENRKPHP